MAHTHHRFWLQAVLTFSLLGPTHGQLNGSFYYTEITQAFPLVFTSPLSHAASLGGQNFTQCCVEAVSQSYSVQNGQIVLNSDNYVLGLSPNQFNTSQFPCGATYTGSAAGAPEVVVSYSWCRQNCGGWEKSSNTPLTQWVQPFVGFILPAAVFCLNVPRKSTVVGVSDQLFGNHFQDLPSQWRRLKRGLSALLDKLVALLTAIFTIVKGLIPRKESEQPTTQLPLGNPVLAPASSTVVTDIMAVLSPGIYLTGAFIIMVIKASIAAAVALVNTIVWVATVFSIAGPMILSGLVEATLDRKLIRKMLNELSEEEEKRKAEPDTYVKNMDEFYKNIHQLYVILVGNLTLVPEKDINDSDDRTVWKDVKGLTRPEYGSQIVSPGGDPNIHFKLVTDTRLKAMLGCQTSFGAAVGAPVVFFVGSFLFSVISNFSSLGDNDTSHALAFGEWWMIIPHVAIVSGCLLAGNNPNTLQVIVCSLTGPWPGKKPEYDASGELIKEKAPLYELGQAYYQSVYTPVWMWERGRSKRRWVAELTKIYPDPPMKRQGYYREARITFRDWVVLVVITLVLMIFPFVLAFLTSYFTPTIGMSCRTFTFLLYFLFQLVLSALWMVDFFTKQKPTSGTGEHKVSMLFSMVLAFTVLGSVFTAVVGTFLQILGVYRNCLCTLPINIWGSRDFNIVISSNSADDIKYANKFWVPTGVTSIVLMIVVCYIGWWYQRHWRIQFRSVVEKLLEVPLTGVIVNGNKEVVEDKPADDGAGGAAADGLGDSAVDEKSSKQAVTNEREVGEDKTEEDGEDKIEEHPEAKD